MPFGHIDNAVSRFRIRRFWMAAATTCAATTTIVANRWWWTRATRTTAAFIQVTRWIWCACIAGIFAIASLNCQNKGENTNQRVSTERIQCSSVIFGHRKRKKLSTRKKSINEDLLLFTIDVAIFLLLIYWILQNSVINTLNTENTHDDSDEQTIDWLIHSTTQTTALLFDDCIEFRHKRNASAWRFKF